jgi:imidazolonepropionase-like amidohydrolase
MIKQFRYFAGSLAAVACLLATAGPSAAAVREFEAPVAITNVTIITEPGTTIEGGTILIVDGRFAAVGRDVEIPPHAERIDGSGFVAYAGLIDAMSYLGVPDTKRSEADRRLAEDVNPDVREDPLVTTRWANRRGIRPQYSVLDDYRPDDKALSTHREHGFATALVAPRYGLLMGRSAVLNLGDMPTRQSVLAGDALLHASFEPGEPGDYPTSLMGAIAVLRQFMLDAEWHARMQKYHDRSPSASTRAAHDPALASIQPVLARQQRVAFLAESDNDIHRALDLAAEFQLAPVIMGGREAYRVTERLAKERVGVIVSLKLEEEPKINPDKPKAPKPGAAPAKPPAPKGDDPMETDPSKKQPQIERPAEDPETPEKAAEEEKEPAKEKEEDPDKEKEEDKEKDEDNKLYEPLKVRRERHRLWAEKVENIIRLQDAGVPFALSTLDVKGPEELLKSLRTLVERGLPEDAALAAMTTSAAELIGLGDQIGRVERGYLANLVIASGSPTEADAFVRYVFIDGKRYDYNVDKKLPTKKKPVKKKDKDETDVDEPAFESEVLADRMPAMDTGGSVLIRGGTVLPIAGPPIENGSVLILGGKIAAIGTNLEAPPDVTEIDATGRFVMPGIVDAHSHLGCDGSVNEGTLSITSEVRIRDVLSAHSVGIYRALAGGTTTHHVMHGSANPIGGQNATVKLKYERPVIELPIADAGRTIKFALGENVKQSNFTGAEGRRFPNSRMGVELTIREGLEAAVRYSTERESQRRRASSGVDQPPFRRDLRLEALADVLSGDLLVHSHCYRSDEILRLLHVAEEYGFRISTLQHVLEGYRVAPEIARHGAGASSFANYWAYKIEAFGAIPHNLALMTRQGVNSSVNSDSPSTIRFLGQEAAKCIRFGDLTEEEALRLITINPALQLGVEKRVGSLEVGKDGDISIWNGHPLNTFSKCVMTLIEGEVYFVDARPEPTEDASTLSIGPPATTVVPPTRHGAYAIVGATIHTMAQPDAAPITDGTIVIVDNRIESVGPGAVIPPGAGVIDGKGLHVYPGMIDANTTLGLYEVGSLRATRDSSEIGTYNPHLRSIWAVHPPTEHVPIARAAGVTTALAMPEGGRVSGVASIIRLSGWTADEMFVADAGLRMSVPTEPVRRGGRGGRGRAGAAEGDGSRTKEALRELEEYVEKARRYAEVRGAFDAGTLPEDAGFAPHLELEAMIPYVQGERPVLFDANSYKHILDTIEFAEKMKLRPVLVGGQEAWKLADALAKKNIPVILSSPLNLPSSEFEPWDSVYRCAGVLDAAGVRVAFSSGSADASFNLGIMVGMAVAHGMPLRRAEYAVTRGAAEILGIAEETGSLEAGKRADLILCTGSPLQTVSKVAHVFIDGQPQPLTNMHSLSYEKYRDRPDPSLPPAPTLRGPPSLTAD